ncbi:hypothetical protein FOF72_05305 [Lactobacillus jensenii]|jgi:hypothetical protein|uniref:hypothetical protein n=1 Tax=Lactobacillus TaxID=1578 RepID=UPI0001B96131|nr:MULTISPECIES: hypothetical protein [Lactobacillus]MCZ3543302.1 hypothetical protein [Lactobacillus gasseri]EEX28213.1 hypothetical protein HMPREF0527_00448 [Lactobacillus jensenii SJ-7A-US]KAA9233664.1 hypothetical protein F6I36_08070 [Lactobacillus jensenii]KAA9258430.1 hypothetical protein F6I24_05110 [Lactobacillus jensenii]MCF1843074.1 hypothetical protein [Lactobacillus jensenii]
MLNEPNYILERLNYWMNYRALKYNKKNKCQKQDERQKQINKICYLIDQGKINIPKDTDRYKEIFELEALLNDIKLSSEFENKANKKIDTYLSIVEYEVSTLVINYKISFLFLVMVGAIILDLLLLLQ